MALKLHPYDSADLIETEEDIRDYLAIAMEGNDPKHIANALGVVARSKGMSRHCQENWPWAAGALHCAIRKWQPYAGNAYYGAWCTRP